ncbi:hypothetical protein [Nonomuraea sp. SYSU D8015]|nr:hypothetical protein [Nonomuraea sp. SYSU D8015]
MDMRPQAFFRRVAGIVDAPWEITVRGDLGMPGDSRGWRASATRRRRC